MTNITRLLVALILLASAAMVEAQTSKAFLRDAGVNAYVDTLLWHRGLSNAKTCSLLTTEKDTSQQFDLAGIDVFAATFIHTKGQGRAGDSVTYALNCSLQLSIDGTNWYTDPLIPIYTTSATATIAEAVHRVYTATPDSAVSQTDVYGPRGKAFVQGSKWGRFVVSVVSDIKDTTYFRGHDLRLYRRP